MRTVRRCAVPSVIFAVLFVGSSAASTLDAPVVRWVVPVADCCSVRLQSV
jgi:hypothetical protein